jgi:hypothetical protein
MADLRFFLSTSHLCNVPPLKKGDEGGFEFDFSCCHRLDFLNELLRHHTSVMKLKFAKEVRVSRPSCSRKRASRSLEISGFRVALAIASLSGMTLNDSTDFGNTTLGP